MEEDWPFPVDFGYESDGEIRHPDLDWLDSMGANRDDFAVVETAGVGGEVGKPPRSRVGGKGFRPLSHLKEAVKSVAVAARTGACWFR